MSSVMKAMQAAHKEQMKKEVAMQEEKMAEHMAERAWRGDPKRKEQVLGEPEKVEEKPKPKAKKKAAAKKKPAAKKKAAPKKKAAKKKSAAKTG